MSCGLPADLVIRPADGLTKVKTISAIKALAARGLTLLRAKRTVETMVENGEAIVHVPMVENAKRLARELGAAGVAVRRVASAPVDVKQIRRDLGLTQEQFALRFGLDIDAVQNWEQGRCNPDRATLAYLRTIAAAPSIVAAAQEDEMV